MAADCVAVLHSLQKIGRAAFVFHGRNVQDALKSSYCLHQCVSWKGPCSLQGTAGIKNVDSPSLLPPSHQSTESCTSPNEGVFPGSHVRETEAVQASVAASTASSTGTFVADSQHASSTQCSHENHEALRTNSQASDVCYHMLTVTIYCMYLSLPLCIFMYK